MKVISVFGSSRPEPGDPDYQLAHDLGRQLAEAGFAVATGGYIGTMTAVSQGAAAVGGHAIGVTCDEIEAWRTVGPNEWITQEVRYRTLWERVYHLVTQNDGIIALPGGVGTLAEVTNVVSSSGINLVAVCAYAVDNRGFIMFVSEDNDRARKLLEEKGYDVREEEVVVLTLDNTPGTLQEATKSIADAGIALTLIYGSVDKTAERSRIVLVSEDNKNVLLTIKAKNNK